MDSFKKTLTSRLIFFVLGGVIFFGGFIVNATWDTGTASGNPLTALMWNDVVGKLVELDSRNYIFECISGSYSDDSTPVITVYPSSLGIVYSFDNVFFGNRYYDGSRWIPQLECINGWTMTGCTASTNGDSADNDEFFVEENKCEGDQNGNNIIGARCCKIN